MFFNVFRELRVATELTSGRTREDRMNPLCARYPATFSISTTAGCLTFRSTVAA